MARKTKRAAKRTSKSVVSSEYRREHKPDAFALALREASQNDDGAIGLKKLAKVCADNGVDIRRWKHLNPGMQAMNASSVLRGVLRRNGSVKLGGGRYTGGAK